MSSMTAPSASAAFDPRVVEVEITLPSGTYTFSSQEPALAIYASGIKVTSASMSTCDCRIFNLTRELRNEILTLGSPLINRPSNAPNAGQQAGTRPILSVSAGRQSSGPFLLFYGNIVTCEMTQPPDIGIVLRALTNSANSYFLLNTPAPSPNLLSGIAQTLAQNSGLTLNFQATDKQIANYVFNGSLQSNIDKLNKAGGIRAWSDGKSLHVINAGQSLKGTSFLINSATGMVGIPQITEQGVMVRVMLNPGIQLGGSVTIDSAENPAANGTFQVVQMNYEIASRDQPFWYNLFCANLSLYAGGGQ